MVAPESDELDYAYCATLDEVLVLAMDHLEQAWQAHDRWKLETHLKMASRAMRCALEMHGAWLTTLVQKEKER